ncbi:SDR family NAD(P)-dependent oxidoreductase [Microbacterium luticocti]|uniref:SDR family NAD(P)-dependent oxidoreductase n=1 Tax=Microbacterium luticocti TaxID=451764 RepID=UPI000409874B|nr:SDR family oxidoreductase [Microbacterium luticocti]
MTLTDKGAIVTGGAGGIGQGIVRHFLKQGAKVLVVDIVDQAAGDELVTGFEPADNVRYLQSDISVAENAPVIVAAAVDAFGKLDILVNNAHASRQAPITETTQEMWDLSLGSGMYATFHLMQAAYPELKKTKGAIVNFASGAGLAGLPNQVTYAAAKEAIRAITRVAAHEWAADGIRANLVAPVALTPGIQQWAQAFPTEYEQVVKGVPLGRLGDPENDIAPAVAFLAGDESRYITGQTLMTDGGSIMLH